MTSLVGIILGMTVMAIAIVEVKAPFKAFINVPSFFIVLGGIIASTLTAFRAQDLFNSLWAFLVIFFRGQINVAKEIEEIAKLSGIHAQEGVGGLEEAVKKSRGTPLKDGLQMFLDGYKWEEVLQTMEAAIALKYEREQTQVKLFRNMGKAAPAFGMVGTVVGLVFMLSQLRDKPDEIGPFLAVALTATLYGLFFANVIFHPMAEKIAVVSETNLTIGRMYVEGVKLIMEKRHPLYVKDRLAGYLAPRDRHKLYAKTESAKAAISKTAAPVRSS